MDLGFLTRGQREYLNPLSEWVGMGSKKQEFGERESGLREAEVRNGGRVAEQRERSPAHSQAWH